MKALEVRCDYCKSNAGQECTGAGSHAGPHWSRVQRAIIRTTLAEADTLALDNARDRRTLEERLMEALR